MGLQHAVEALALSGIGARQRRRLCELRYDRGLHGYDPFGLHAGWMAIGLAVAGPLYHRWFRVSSRGIENVPKEGPAILVANHGGELPFDGLMLWHDVVVRSGPPRVPRFVMDHFVLELPFVSTFFVRCGGVGGSRGDVHELLERGELVAAFPEGTAAIGKPRTQRYRVQPLRVGTAEMAIRHRAPMIPVAIVGPDDQYPLVAHLPLRAFEIPYLPISPFPLPLPVRYSITYGAPLRPYERWSPQSADRPDVVAEATEELRVAMQSLLDSARKDGRS